MKIRVISSTPYHALFMKQMLIRAPNAQINNDFTSEGPDFTIINSGEFVSDEQIQGVTSKVSVDLNFTDK
jgi:phosphoenolpyruvate carboxykinase (ATP)